MTETYGRGTPSNLRGWLSEVYFPALVSSQAHPLALRLGDRATVDDPLFGRCEGPEIATRLEAMATWMAIRDASYEKFAFVMGSDRDVTEGWLTLTAEGARVRIPVAVVAERRKEREVELRAYYATGKLGAYPDKPASRSLVASGEELLVPPPVAGHIEALGRADVDAAVGSFENGGTVRGSDGDTHAKLDGGGPLRAYYERLLCPHGAPAGLTLTKNARADDGSTIALEYSLVRAHGRGMPSQVGLAVYERGESGLLRTVRIYDDVAV